MSRDDDLIRVPSKAMFTDIASGVATTADVEGGISITHASNGGAYALFGMGASVPAAPYTLTTKMDYNGNASGQVMGHGIYASDGTKYETFGVFRNAVAAGNVYSAVSDWSDRSTPISNPVFLLAPWFSEGTWLRLNDDNANRTWSISKDGVNFTTVYQVVRTSYFTPTSIGFYINPHSDAIKATLNSWRVQ